MMEMMDVESMEPIVLYGITLDNLLCYKYFFLIA